MNQDPICPHCNSNKVIKKGFHSKDGVQKLKCKRCSKSFRPRYKSLASLVTNETILNLKHEGLSIRGIAKELKISPTTVGKRLKAMKVDDKGGAYNPSDYEYSKLFDELTVYFSGRAGEPMDLAQEVLIRIIEKSPSVSDFESLRAYARKVAKNHLKNFYRFRGQLKRQGIMVPLDPRQLVTESEPDEQLDKKIRAQQLMVDSPVALAGKVYRAQGYTYEEVAEKLDLSISKVRTLLDEDS